MNARVKYVLLALATIGLGLIVHQFGSVLRPTWRDVLGDVLWASMIAWWIGAISPDASIKVRIALAIAICFAVEVSQLYHSPAFDNVRGTTLGALTLGSGFDPRDLVAYTIGVLLAAALERTSKPFRP